MGKDGVAGLAVIKVIVISVVILLCRVAQGSENRTDNEKEDGKQRESSCICTENDAPSRFRMRVMFETRISVTLFCPPSAAWKRGVGAP
jgi:hypothetical protein